MAGIRDEYRLGEAGGTPTRITGNGRRTSSSEIDILHIDDSRARKTLSDFYKVAKEGAKSTSEEMRKMWELYAEYSDNYYREERRNLDDLSKRRDEELENELRRIRYRYLDNSRAERAISEARRKYNTDQLKIMKEVIKQENQRAAIESKRAELIRKYGNSRIGRDIQEAENLRIQIENNYKDADRDDITEEELRKIAFQTDDLERQLDTTNKKIERSINRREQITEGIKKSIKQFLNEAVTILTHNYLEGIQGYFNSYENTFTEFAGRLGTNYDQTRKFYSDIITETYNNRMDTAISISKELIPSVQKALEKGFTGNEAIAKAIADEQSRILMPWLDTQSDAWVNMSFNMSKQNMDLLKSQQLQLRTTKEGNRLLQTGVINNLTDEIEPLLRDVEYNTGNKGFSSKEEQAALLALINEGKMDPKEAYSIISKAIQIQKSGGYEYLASGDTVEKLMAEAYVNGGGTIDMLKAILPVLGVASSGSNLDSGAVLSILGGSLPLTSKTSGSAQRLENAILAAPRYLEQLEVNEGAYVKELEGINGKLSATKSQENKQQNDTARVGEWISAIPQGDKWFSAILELGEGILAVITAGFGGNVLSRALGLGSGNSFLSRLLGGSRGNNGGSPTAPIGGNDTTINGADRVGWGTILSNRLNSFSSGVNNFLGGTQGLAGFWAPFLDYFTYNTSIGRALTGKGTWDDVSQEISDTVSNIDTRINNVINGGHRFRMTPEESLSSIEGLEGADKDRALYEELWDYYRNFGTYGPGSNSNNRINLLSYAEGMGLSPRDADMVARNIVAYGEEAGRKEIDLSDSFFGREGLGIGSIYEKDFADDKSKYMDAFDRLTKKYFDIYHPHAYEKGYNNPTQINEYKFTDKENEELWNYGINDVGLTRRELEEIIPIIYDLVESGDWKLYHRTNGMTDNFWKSEYGQRLSDNLNFSYAVGSPYITKDQIAMLHKGERVLTSGQNAVFDAIGSTGLLLAGSSLINRLLGISSIQDNSNDDMSRDEMTDTLMEGMKSIVIAVTNLSNNNGINNETRTLPRITNSYNNEIVNFTPTIAVSR